MEPFDILSQLLKINRRIATFLFAGLGLLAVIAIATSWAVDVRTAMIMGSYFIGLTTLLFTFVAVIRDPILQRVLAWFVTLMIIVTTLVLFYSAVSPGQNAFAPAYCLVRFWERCVDVQEAVADRNKAPPTGVTPPAPAPAVHASDYIVYVQFAGLISRDSVKTMMSGLSQNGWNVQGVSRGGERTSSAAGVNEIRYGKEEDKAAADALANAVNAYGLSSSKVGTLRVPSIGAKRLEVWISR